MKDKLLRWLFEPLIFEVNREDGSGWGCEYNRAAVGVIGAVGTLLLVLVAR